MYIKTDVGLGQPPMLHGFLAGMLGEDIDSKKALDDFLNELRTEPKNLKEIPLDRGFAPRPRGEASPGVDRLFYFVNRLDISWMSF